MPNYQSRVNNSNDTDSLIGGALNMLSQYEANVGGDQYSAKNPSSKFLDQQSIQSLNNLGNVATATGGSLIHGGAADHLKGGKHMKVAHAVLSLTPHAFHALKHTAHGIRHHFGKGSVSKTHKGDLDFTTKRGDKDFHRGGHDEKEGRHPFDKISGGALEMGAVNDLCMAKGRQHLADMVAKDHELKGGDFLDTLGNVAKTVAPFLAFL